MRRSSTTRRPDSMRVKTYLQPMWQEAKPRTSLFRWLSDVAPIHFTPIFDSYGTYFRRFSLLGPWMSTTMTFWATTILRWSTVRTMLCYVFLMKPMWYPCSFSHFTRHPWNYHQCVFCKMSEWCFLFDLQDKGGFFLWWFSTDTLHMSEFSYFYFTWITLPGTNIGLPKRKTEILLME